jgi:hypothetical protein
MGCDAMVTSCTEWVANATLADVAAAIWPPSASAQLVNAPDSRPK